MSRERWGTFSVNDHTLEYAFAADVLMYDRLIIPRPDNPEERSVWASAGWNPERLESFLEVLRADTPNGRAITVPWNQTTRDLYNARAETARVVDEEAHYGLTRRLLTAELRPEAPPGALPTAVIPAYPSIGEAGKEWIENEEHSQRETLTLAVKHRFVVPDRKGKTERELLQIAVDLADAPGFKEKRAKLYGWQDDVIRSGIDNEHALEEMEQYISDYNTAVQQAVDEVYTKFAFSLVPIALTALTGPIATLAGIGSNASLVRFWIFDRKPVIRARESEVAAILHDIAELGWRSPSNLSNSRC
jgi:hypothetical protein